MPADRIQLTDDGTLDTVLRCSQCGQEFRGNYDPTVLKDVTQREAEEAYLAFVKDFIKEVDDEHECEGEEFYRDAATQTGMYDYE